MKFSIKAVDLIRALKEVRGAVAKRSTIPILSNVLLSSNADGTISVAGTDLDLEIRVNAVTQAGAESTTGATTVSADTMFAFVSKLDKDVDIKIEHDVEKSMLRLVAKRSRVSLPTLPVDDFPEFKVDGLTHTFTLTRADVETVFGKAQFAISTEETRYYLNGIYFHHAEGASLRGVATDGHRLARIDIALPDGAAGMPGVIVPRKTITEVLRLVAGAETVTVGLSAAKIRFDFGGTVLSSKLIDGTFPDYGRVIPVGQNLIAKLDREGMASAADRVSTVSSDRGRAVKMSFSKKLLALAVVNPESGSAEEEMEADYDGDDFVVGFNSRYVGDILGQLGSDQVTMAMSDPGSPAVFKDESDAGALFVLMPMRV